MSAMFDKFSARVDNSYWRVLFTCADCGADVVRVVRVNPDELVRCFECEAAHVHRVSDRLLRLALSDRT